MTSRAGYVTRVPEQVQRAAPGITYRKLDYWTRVGYLRPPNPTPGTGEARVWTAEELAVARLMVLLTKAGLSAEVAARVAREGPGRHELGPGLMIEVQRVE